MQCFIYWLLGHLEEAPEALARLGGLYKGVQSAGGAVSWALSTRCSPSAQAWVNIGPALLALPTTTVVVALAPGLRGAGMGGGQQPPHDSREPSLVGSIHGDPPAERGRVHDA